MPYEYNIPQLERFSSAYEEVGIFLRVLYQPYACDILEELIKNKELTVKDIRARLGTEVPNFLISKSLTSLKNRNIVDKTGNLYVLTNPHFYKKLYETAVQIKKQLGIKPHEKATCNDVKSVAEFLNHLFFDNTSNILLHILLKKPLSFSDILDTYRSNHGYIARAKVRYHLTHRSWEVCGVAVEIFKEKAKKYSITQKGRQLHEIFDKFIVDYETIIDEWINNVWEQPIKNFVSENVPIVYLRDPIYKVIKVLDKHHSAIVFSNEIEGIITAKDVMNNIGDNMTKEGFLSDIKVKDIMTPITAQQVISSETTLSRIYAREKGFRHTQYIVNTGRETYGVLNLITVIQEFNKI